MKLSSNYEYENRSPKNPIPRIIGSMVLVTAVLGGVLYAGSKGMGPVQSTAGKAKIVAAESETLSEKTVKGSVDSSTQSAYAADGAAKDIEKLYQEKKLTSQDLDFWDMYPKEEPELLSPEEIAKEEAKEREEELGVREKYEKREAETADAVTAEEEGDENQTLLTYADKTTEWVVVNPYLEKHSYDFTALVKKADQLSYLENGKKSSYLGADISKYNGEVDFTAMKEAGIEFVMLRVGARGYGSGEIKADEAYVQNIAAATEAGLDVGLYFFSQAITKEEAAEEANYLISSIGDYKITYPIAFDMEYVANDTSRVEALTKEQKTELAKTFLDTIQSAGYKPMLYGTKEWLIQEIDLTRLTGYDIWLSQQKETPDYPYQFQMWQYSTDGKVDGVTGTIDLNLSFIDYAEK